MALAELLADLVRIDSINPDLIEGGAGEGEIARFVARWLEAAGLEVEVEEVAPGRFNTVGIARGSGGGKTLLLNAHMDIVGVAGMERPFEPVVEDGRMYGRGAYDMKAGLAAIMLAGAEAAGAGLAGDPGCGSDLRRCRRQSHRPPDCRTCDRFYFCRQISRVQYRRLKHYGWRGRLIAGCMVAGTHRQEGKNAGGIDRSTKRSHK